MIYHLSLKPYDLFIYYCKMLLLRIYVLMHSNALHTFTIYTGKITPVKADKI